MCDMSNINMKQIGIWISEKKSQKLNWKELTSACVRRGYNLIKLDLDLPLDKHGYIDVFLHKLTDVIATGDLGDPKAKAQIKRVEKFIQDHPEMVVIDPLDNVRILLDRYRYYSILENEESFQAHGIFTPPFAKLTSTCFNENMEILRSRGITFPLVCKPAVAHGSKSAHEMVIIFNERGLSACKPPCVVQSFINHNAVLYKVFLIGNRYSIRERPSLKNFYPCKTKEPIHYNSGDVCKADSQSTLSILDPQDKPHAELKVPIDEGKVQTIIKILRKHLDLLLVGFDIVIDNITGDFAIIDINYYPGYDNFPNYFEHLINCIDEEVLKRKVKLDGSENGVNSVLSNEALENRCKINFTEKLINVDLISDTVNNL